MDERIDERHRGDGIVRVEIEGPLEIVVRRPQRLIAFETMHRIVKIGASAIRFECLDVARAAAKHGCPTALVEHDVERCRNLLCDIALHVEQSSVVLLS